MDWFSKTTSFFKQVSWEVFHSSNNWKLRPTPCKRSFMQALGAARFCKGFQTEPYRRQYFITDSHLDCKMWNTNFCLQNTLIFCILHTLRLIAIKVFSPLYWRCYPDHVFFKPTFEFIHSVASIFGKFCIDIHFAIKINMLLHSFQNTSTPY